MTEYPVSEWFATDPVVSPVSPACRAFQYGDGLFETIAVRNSEPRLWDYHVARLTKGCERLGLVVQPAKLLRALENVIATCNLDTARCIAKIIVTAADAGRGYGRAMPSDSNVFIGVFEATSVNRRAYRDGVATILCETRLATGSPLAGIKTLNRLEQVLARSECLEADAFEGFTRDADDRLICGTISNMFIVQDKAVRTPSVERCGVAGTMRQLVIDLLAREGSVVDVCDLTERDLATADEVFITNSQMGVVPVRRCGDNAWSVGDNTRQVMRLVADFGVEESRL